MNGNMGTENKYSDLNSLAELLKSELCKVKTKLRYFVNTKLSQD